MLCEDKAVDARTAGVVSEQLLEVSYLTLPDEGPPSAPKPDTADAPKRQEVWRGALQVALLTSIWWISSMDVVMVIRWTVAEGAVFPYAFAFTSITQPSAGLLVFLLSRVSRCKGAVALTRGESLQLLAMGLLQGAEIGLTNKCLEYLTVASRTMINSTGVLFVMATARLWGLERLNAPRLVSALLFVAGGSCQALGHAGQERRQRSTHAVGVAMQLLSIALGSQRWALAQHVLQRSHAGSALAQISRLELLGRVLPITGIVCLLLSLCFEGEDGRTAYTWDGLTQPMLAANVVLVAAGLSAMLRAELELVQRLSAVAFNVLATLHQIPIVLAGVMIMHNRVGCLPCLGFGFCIAAALLYATARWREPEAAGSGRLSSEAGQLTSAPDTIN